jgi:hypothetical protein
VSGFEDGNFGIGSFDDGSFRLILRDSNENVAIYGIG